MPEGTETEFERAIECAMRKLEPLFVEGKLEPRKREPSELYWVMMLQFSAGRDELGEFYVLSEEADQILFAAAEWDRGAFDLYRKVIAQHVDRKAELSATMRNFLQRLLFDKIEVPKPQLKKAGSFELNLRIVMIADHLTENFALPRIGNARGPHHSVCDAISAAFVRLGHHRKTKRAIQELLVHKSSSVLRSQAQFYEALEAAHPVEQPEEFMKLLEAAGEIEGEEATEMLNLLRNASG